MWFRIELNKDGGISSCVQTEASQSDAGKKVYYIEADSAAEAASAAVVRYRDYLKRQSESVNSRRAERRSAGQCPRCGVPVTEGTWCADCLEHHNGIRNGRIKPGKQGRVSPRVQEMRLVAAGRSQREAILSEILDAAIRMRAGVAFTSWLRNQLEHARSVSRKAAAAE
jgi:hypothetical protein